MQTIEEIAEEGGLLEQLATAQTVLSASNRDARIRGFKAVFKKVCRTPSIIRMLLQSEFSFDGQVDCCTARLDPDWEERLLAADWYRCTFVVPNFSNMTAWAIKCLAEYRKGRTVVAAIPARTNTEWFHKYVLPEARELRFVQGRLHFPGFKEQAPFPTIIAVFSRGPLSIPVPEAAAVLAPDSAVRAAAAAEESAAAQSAPEETAPSGTVSVLGSDSTKLAIVTSFTGGARVKVRDEEDGEEEEEGEDDESDDSSSSSSSESEEGEE
jgi:hypothetical protein